MAKRTIPETTPARPPVLVCWHGVPVDQPCPACTVEQTALLIKYDLDASAARQRARQEGR